MFTIVGYVIEVVSKMALRDVFKSWLWDPLGMTSTYYSLQEAKTTNKLATPYWWNDRTQKYVTLPHADIPQSGGAGVIISNVVDYAKYLRSMINKTLPISPAGHTALTNAHMLMAESGAPYFTGPMWYGLGWQGAVFKNEVMYHHNGAVDGFLATMAFFPGRKFGVVITSNAFSPTHDIVFWQVINDFFDVPQKDRVNISAL
jgi:CubicO group peptidase (beta-lactamase class C family)